MDAVWKSVPESFLRERRALGLDRRDELWEGVLHMVPPPASHHNELNIELAIFLRRVLRARDLRAFVDPMGLFAPDVEPQSWRVPDITIARPAQLSQRGVEGAVVVIEVLSPHDESRDKFGFFWRVGVEEVWIIDPGSRDVEIYARTATPGEFARLPTTTSPRLGIAFSIVAGPRLRVADGDDAIEL